LPLGIAVEIGAVAGGRALGTRRRPVAVILGLGDATLLLLGALLLGQRGLAPLLERVEIGGADIAVDLAAARVLPAAQRLARLRPHQPVGRAGVEAERGEPALHLTDTRAVHVERALGR